MTTYVSNYIALICSEFDSPYYLGPFNSHLEAAQVATKELERGRTAEVVEYKPNTNPDFAWIAPLSIQELRQQVDTLRFNLVNHLPHDASTDIKRNTEYLIAALSKFIVNT